MSKKKLAKSVGAVVVAGAIAVGATFAWQGQTQRARNEVQGAVNPGGRLHDDYFIQDAEVIANGATKRVYVENYSADQYLYVRVKLREYMETGEGAGTNKDQEARPGGVSVMAVGGETPKITDSTTWHTYKLGESGPFRNVWDWSLGGEAVTYLPTFNKNNDSVVPDVNGSWEAEFADYIDWAKLATGDAAETAKLPGYQSFTAADSSTDPATPAKVSGWEVYDGDSDAVDEANLTTLSGYQVGIDTRERDKYVYGSHFVNDDGEIDFNITGDSFTDAVTAYSTAADADKAAKLAALQKFYQYDASALGDNSDTAADLDVLVGTASEDGVPAPVPHDLKTTAGTEKVIPMAAWLALPAEQKTGNFWVYDTDGWAYWANPLAPKAATGCLLNGYTAKLTGVPQDDWYYAIDVDMECGTAGAWAEEGNIFQANSLTENGEFLLNVIAGIVDPVTGGKIVQVLSDDVQVVQLGSFKKDGAELARATIPFSAGYGTSWFHSEVIANQLAITGNLETYNNTGTYSFGDTPTTEANAIQWVKIRDTANNKYMYICDRSLLANVTFNQLAGTDTAHAPLGTANYTQGPGVDTTIDGVTYKLRLLTGGIYDSNKSGDGSYDGACSTDTANDYAYSEWDRYIGGYADYDTYKDDPNYPGTIKGLPVPTGEAVDDVPQKSDYENEHNKLWNWFAVWDWCQEIVNGSTNRSGRGSSSARDWHGNVPGTPYAYCGFRPCFEVAIPTT